MFSAGTDFDSDVDTATGNVTEIDTGNEIRTGGVSDANTIFYVGAPEHISRILYWAQYTFAQHYIPNPHYCAW